MRRTAAPDFDRVAHIYRWAEYLALGPLLERTRNHFLPELRSSRQALALGDGDGRFLAGLLRQNTGMVAHAVDSSGTMLQLLRRRCGFASRRLTTEQASALEIAWPQGTDLIVTHFFLDCFAQAEVERLAKAAAQLPAGTLWVISDFGVPSAPWLRPLAAAYVRCLYLAFAALTGLTAKQLPDAQAALRRAGFSLVARHQHLAGLLYSELWKREGVG